ncbi:hypothetical protein QQF64_025050 [Cirrhinus molitorella]|uniref:Uncharacterized protein n=1 Tax=Cirrhinus molitorella TaxID=172907 RepID=A0ABR3NNB6_9TELE
MQTPPASYSPTLLHISHFFPLPLFFFIYRWLLYLMHQSILKHVTDRIKHQQRDVRFEDVYTSNNPKLTNAFCFPSYSKGNCSVDYSIEHFAVKIPVVLTLY